jgi:hypothetical protein
MVSPNFCLFKEDEFCRIGFINNYESFNYKSKEIGYSLLDEMARDRLGATIDKTYSVKFIRDQSKKLARKGAF